MRDDTSVLSITYFSSATRLLGDVELLGLLEECRARNTASDITGIMLYRGGNFVQVLEGPEEAVRKTFRRIEADPRHTGMLVTLEQRVDERDFPEWSMGFGNVSDADVADVPGYSDYLRRHPSLQELGERRSQVHLLLQVFRKNVR